MMETITGHVALAWLAAAVLLGLAELAVPGVFLIFLAIAAAITAATTLAVPEVSLAAQLGSFAAWSSVAVLIGKRWYVDYPVDSDDALLNDRMARLIGETVVVEQALVNEAGRVRVGDGVWPATGPDATAGTEMRIVGHRGGVLAVEPVTTARP